MALTWPWPVKVSYQRSQGIHAAGQKQAYSQDCNAAARLFPDVVKALYRSRGCEGSLPCAAIRCSHRQTVEWRSSVSRRSGSGRIGWSPSRVTGKYRVCDIAGCLALPIPGELVLRIEVEARFEEVVRSSIAEIYLNP